MNFNYNLKIIQEQKMILTQSMQQSIKLLQMSMHDLRKYIYNEYSENPILEMEKKSKPFSDQALANLLKEKDTDISRRTVSRYKEKLGIKALSIRKRI